MPAIEWTDYLKYRAKLRGFDLTRLENIIRRSDERYFDTETLRVIAIGRHDLQLVAIPYELNEDVITPVTVSCHNAPADTVSTANWEIYP